MRKRLHSKAFLRKSRLLFNLILKFLLFALVIFLICIFIKRSNFFKVKDIKVFGAETFVNKKDLENVLYSSVVNKNITEINTSQLRVSVLTNFQGAKDIDIKKIFPNKIIVNVHERTPIALLQNSKTDEIFIIDNVGYVLGTVATSASNLPRISYEGDIKIGRLLAEVRQLKTEGKSAKKVDLRYDKVIVSYE